MSTPLIFQMALCAASLGSKHAGLELESHPGSPEIGRAETYNECVLVRPLHYRQEWFGLMTRKRQPPQPQPQKKPRHDKSSDEEYPQSPENDEQSPPSRSPEDRDADNNVIAPDGTPSPEREPEPLL